MKDIERRRFETFVRVRDFGTTYGSAFAAGSLGETLFASVSSIVAELEGHAATQASGASASVQGTASRATARAALVEDLEAISRTASISDSDTPGLGERFRLPRNNRNDQQLLSTARAFAQDAVPFKAEFIRHEMPADFLEDLNADIAAFEQAVKDQNLKRTARVSATESIDTAIERGVKAVRALDAIVRNKFRNDPAVLAAWTSASHTERAPRTARKTDAAPTPAPKFA
jgi:hypothetical protein